MQVQALSTEKPMGTKESLPDLHWGRMNIQVAWHAIREAIIERDENVCTMCGEKGHTFDELEVHHIIPRSMEGSDHPHNLVTLCKKCHHGRVHGGQGNASKPADLVALPGKQVDLGEF
jgi:5-methylcytosine-specific restriction endonuclease McrA